MSREQTFEDIDKRYEVCMLTAVPTLRTSDLTDSANWLDPAERRIRLFGWTDRQVAALYVALGLELSERNVALQPSLLELEE